jgi:hypothetical protein
MNTNTRFGLTGLTIFLIALPTLARQNPAPKMGMGGKMPEHCMKMGQMQHKMAATTSAQDAKLKELMAAVDRASGDQKISAMSAVIRELVAQRSSRATMMDQMQPQMMGHMMEHMQSGDKKSMMKCPMMSGGMMGGGMGMMGHDMSKMKPK